MTKSNVRRSKRSVSRRQLVGLMRRLSAGSALLFLAACSTSPPEVPAGEVRVLDEEIVISGYISERIIEQIRAISNVADFNQVRVDIYDGEPQASMQLGYFIHRNQMDIVVEGQCLGPCANYLFTAARNKYLTDDAVVAWSGGALAESWTQQNQRLLIPGIRHVAEQYMDAFLRREARYFQRIGVDQRVTALGYHESSGCAAPEYEGFYYSLPQLLRFGITDVQLADNNWRDAFSHYPEQFCQVDLSAEHEALSR